MCPRLPVGSQLVIFPTAFGIAQNLVGFVEFLELFFGRFLVLGDIGMILAREPAKCLLDFFVRRPGSHPEYPVIVFEFNGHVVRVSPMSGH